MASSVWSLAQILAGFAVSAWLGFGASYFLLPRENRHHAPLAAPAAGYALFCLGAIAISANFNQTANASVWYAFAALSAVSIGALVAATRDHEPGSLWRESRAPAAAAVLMVAVMFWPVLRQGLDLFLGTANIDLYQSLSYQEVLTRYDIAALAPRPRIDYSLDPFLDTFPDTLPARFGGVMFSMLQQKLLGSTPRAALMSALIVFLLALPFAMFLFARAVMELSERAARIAAVLVAVSGPVAMSFVHVLVGQNSSLALLPLTISVLFLALRTTSWRALVFAVLLVDAIFWVYVSILPYVLAPVGVYALYRAATVRGAFLRWALAASIGVAVLIVVLQAGMFRETKQLATEIAVLFARANRSVYVDFLTEMALPYATGLSSYPLTSFVLFPRHASLPVSLAVRSVFIAFAFAVAAFLASSLVSWARRASTDGRVLVVGAFVIYLAVCVYFTAISLYGYALFKMAAWLQFLFIPIAAYGIDAWLVRRPDGGAAARRIALAAAGLVGAIYVGANLVSALDFGAKSLGHDRERGAIVNSYGIGGNQDYPALEAALARLGKRGDTVAIGMTDYIANLWAAYYVSRAGLRAAMLSHDDFPDEDANLPDIRTSIVTNTAGRQLVYRPKYSLTREPDFYLLGGLGNLNREIVETNPTIAATWADDTFMLARPGDVKDVLVTGRGFYRLEYFDRERLSWWWPERMRWSAEGGEFILLHATRPDTARRLSFVAIAGTDRERPRHLELWLNGELIDRVEVHGAARLVSKPFHPTGGPDKLVVRIAERVELAPARFGLWNRHVAVDPRYLNMVIAQVRLVRETDRSPPVTGNRMTPKDILEMSTQFDGISLDGWSAPRAYIELPIGVTTRSARLALSVPGWAGFQFPLRVQFNVNGRTVEKQFTNPGDHLVELPIEMPAGHLRLEMTSSQSTRIPDVGSGSFVIKSLTVL